MGRVVLVVAGRPTGHRREWSARSHGPTFLKHTKQMNWQGVILMFSKQPLLTPWHNPIYGENEYRLCEDFAISVKGMNLIIPEGFGYDGATIPSVAWQLVYSPFDPLMMLPALVHDWLYSSHDAIPSLKYKTADEILFTLCKGNGVPYAKCLAIESAVKATGGFFWKTNDEDKKYLAYLRQHILDSGRDPKSYYPPV